MFGYVIIIFSCHIHPLYSTVLISPQQGIYIEGARIGQRCVSKQFKTGSVYEDHYFDEELSIISHSQAIIDSFNAANILPGQKILLNRPEIWESIPDGCRSLIEPMIENFEKFNSNSGWTSGGEWSNALQALSHFSYHNSGGQFLLCDLQGGSYSDGL